MGKIKRSQDYRDYLAKHIGNMRDVWDALQDHLKGEYTLSDEIYFKLMANVWAHDKSKFGKHEFEAYRQWFFPDKGETRNREIFNQAVNHHYNNNPHHWNHWVMYDKDATRALPMPFVYVLEMLMDWTAVGINFHEEPGNYYNLNKNRMFLELSTKSIIDIWLPVFNRIAVQIIKERTGKLTGVL